MAKLFHTKKTDPLTPFNRIHISLYSVALLTLFYHHYLTSHFSPSLILLLIAHLILALMWALVQPLRWRPIRRQQDPDLLLEYYKTENLPPLDVFVCTADPWKEPPITVVNTALSVMAYDYPAEKLSVYVSDDGCSDLTLFAFMEVAKFARNWLPFCKERGILCRSPEIYFAESVDQDHDFSELKIIYEKMKEKVESCMEKGRVGNDLVMDAEEYDLFKKWQKNFPRGNHPSIIKFLLESRKDLDIRGNPMPNLVYVSREKRPKCSHHFKAGALNVLLRVSSIMTNAPAILILDCDMYSNDPQTPLRALCYILDPQLAPSLAFVQFPQRYNGVNKNDIYGCEMKRAFRIYTRGMDGLQGPNFVGTGCFFMRRALHSDLSEKDSTCSENVIKRAYDVSGCNYEVGTKWGEIIGFRYGSVAEDFFTGFQLHCEGWVSVFCDPERAAFLGDVPKNMNDLMEQSSRWALGLLEVAFSKYSPLVFHKGNDISFFLAMGYKEFSLWGIWCIPLTIYALLPQLTLIYDVPLFPKLSDPWFYLYAYLFLATYGHDFAEFLFNEGTIPRWWCDQRMWLIRGPTSLLSATIQLTLNKLGISAPGFTVTSKVSEAEQNERYDNGVFDFGVESPFFVMLGTVVIINLSSFILGVAKATRKEAGFDEMFVQLFLTGFCAVNSWPIVEAMFVRRDGGKMPTKVTSISMLFAGIISILGYIAFEG